MTFLNTFQETFDQANLNLIYEVTLAMVDSFMLIWLYYIKACILLNSPNISLRNKRN